VGGRQKAANRIYLGGNMREQIQNCGCRVRPGLERRHWIAYCPTHAAAPDLLEALRRAIAEASAPMGDGGIRLETVELAKAAIAKATAGGTPGEKSPVPRKPSRPMARKERRKNQA
jgi:hypothetical protein